MNDPGQEISAFAAYNSNKRKKITPKKTTSKNISKPKRASRKKKDITKKISTALSLAPEISDVRNENDIVIPNITKIKKAVNKRKNKSVNKSLNSAELEENNLRSPEVTLKKVKKEQKQVEEIPINAINETTNSSGKKTRKTPKKRAFSFCGPLSPVNKNNGFGTDSVINKQDISFEKLKLNNGNSTKKSKANKRKNETFPIRPHKAGSSVHATLNSTLNSFSSTENLKSPQNGVTTTIISSSKIKHEKLTPSVPLSKLSPNSIKEGKTEFKRIIAPISVEDFLENFWEKAHCLIQRNDPKYFSELLSFGAVDQMLLKNHVEFTKNIDITSYKNGVRETLNPEGRAVSPVVWDYYANGCSIRLLNPQTFLPSVYSMNAKLQEYFHCMVGANVYITPPQSQGFAPHYDDIEAFVIQIEGQKRWKLYNPRSPDEELPRVSSKNFAQNDIGKPILDKVLKPGDVLYFPRGIIHQAETQPGFHSMHITLSVYQKHSYADLLEILLPQMLSNTIATDVELRKGLPLNIWKNLGVVNLDQKSNERDNIVRKCNVLLSRVFDKLKENIDDAVDQMAKRFQHDALPPEVNEFEMARTVFGSCTTVNKRGEIENNCTDIDMNSKVRLFRANAVRLVRENEKICIYYYVDNSREYHEYEPNFIEIEEDDALAVEQLINTYPCYVAVKQLEVAEERKIDIVQSLWNRGLLMLEHASP